MLHPVLGYFGWGGLFGCFFSCCCLLKLHSPVVCNVCHIYNGRLFSSEDFVFELVEILRGKLPPCPSSAPKCSALLLAFGTKLLDHMWMPYREGPVFLSTVCVTLQWCCWGIKPISRHCCYILQKIMYRHLFPGDRYLYSLTMHDSDKPFKVI